MATQAMFYDAMGTLFVDLPDNKTSVIAVRRIFITFDGIEPTVESARAELLMAIPIDQLRRPHHWASLPIIEQTTLAHYLQHEQTMRYNTVVGHAGPVLRLPPAILVQPVVNVRLGPHTSPESAKRDDPAHGDDDLQQAHLVLTSPVSVR
jgi:hypothetical protein